MPAFAIYRLPHDNCCTLVEQTEGEPAEFVSCAELNGCRGFVVAPFEVSASQPILLITPSRTSLVPVESLAGELDDYLRRQYLEGVEPAGTRCGDRATYDIDFANFHAQLEKGVFRKIVLSRCAAEPNHGDKTPLALFREACQRYPRMFISLVYTSKSGCWLTATPEILLEQSAGCWRTIALAGTMRLEGDLLNGEGETLSWSTKNIQEQRIVSTYITECLEQFTSEFHEEGPRTVRAADLVHLRSDFTFSLPDAMHLGHLLHVLHPTPAVCGLPKHEAFRFILANERTPRRYYSGFMGPLRLLAPSDGKVFQEETHLFVSLRCMNITSHTYYLYAGGGLLKDSVKEQEWQETEAKLETMRRILYNP